MINNDHQRFEHLPGRWHVVALEFHDALIQQIEIHVHCWGGADFDTVHLWQRHNLIATTELGMLAHYYCKVTEHDRPIALEPSAGCDTCHARVGVCMSPVRVYVRV